MDIKSILRAFRYSELQQRADRDPAAKRPPTIKFLGVALAIGLLTLGFAVLVMNLDEPGGDATTLTVSDPTMSTPPSTATTPTSASGTSVASAQSGPAAG